MKQTFKAEWSGRLGSQTISQYNKLENIKTYFKMKMLHQSVNWWELVRNREVVNLVQKRERERERDGGKGYLSIPINFWKK